MIVIKISGGIGNQLFQYAVARNLSIKHGVPFLLDLEWFERFPVRQYKLKNFNIEEHIGTKKEIWPLKKHGRRAGWRHCIQNFLYANDSLYKKEKFFHFDPAILEIKDNAYLDGNWQSEKYFYENRDTIRKDFTLKTTPSSYFIEVKKKIEQNKTSNETAVSLHIRRGDYASDPKVLASIGLCSIEYYQEAAKIIASKVSHPVFYIFSDDIEWVKNNLKLSFPTQYISHPEKDKDYEELFLMASCSHHIMANSSFSWWGAWLNPNNDKIIIAPKQWFKDTTRDTKDLLPEGWLRI